MKGQVAIEYLIIMGIALVVLLPIFVFFSSGQSNYFCNVHEEQARSAALEIVDVSETISYLGEPSKTRVKVNLPSSLTQVDVNGYEIVLFVCNGKSEIVVGSSVNITGSVSETGGVTFVDVVSRGSYVNLS